MNYDAFISYRREGGASQARLIKSELTSRGYRVFLDVADLEKGHFDEKLLATIAQTPNFLLVLAPSSLDRCVNESDWLRRELRHAMATKRNIVPICLPGFFFPPSLPADIAELSRHQAVEYSHTLFEATLEKILKAIGKPAEASGVSRRLTLAGAGATAAAAAGALLYKALKEPDPQPSAQVPAQKPGPLFTATVVPMVASEKAAITFAAAPTTAAPVDNGTPPPSGTPDPALYTVNYRYDRTADGFVIDYRLPYLDLLRAGGPVAGIRYETSPFFEPFPPFRATIANNTAQQILITSVVLDIADSELRREVVITVDEGSTNTIVFVNHGWGDVEDAKLEFTLADPKSRFVSPPQEVRLGTFSASKIVPIAKFIPPELASVGEANVAGTLAYGPAEQHQTLKFTSRVQLQTQSKKPLKPAEAYDLYFTAGEKGRIVADLPTAHQVKPGEAEVFDLRISTDRSSTTQIKMSFLTADGQEIPANQLTLNLFVPRFAGMQLKQRATRSNR